MTTTTTATNYWTATAAATAATAAAAMTPVIKLTPDERAVKSDEHKFGLCCSCDAGLDDRADFEVDNRASGGFALMCHACVAYYTGADEQ
jgi:hypothetical protein